MNSKPHLFFMFAVLILLAQACNLPGSSPPTATSIPPSEAPASEAPPTEMPAVQHQVFPALAPDAKMFYDVESVSTAAEKRAPYGDSYDINRFERPFLQDMTYIPDLDIRTFSLSQDADWFYVSIELIGVDPNNQIGINYGVEFDTNLDGFGDFVIVSNPPYVDEWEADNVRIYADKNRNTAGLSPAKSDAPFLADGYETLIFDGGQLTNEDPDLAWARMNVGPNATIQFAIKRSFIGNMFMFGVFADAGLKDISKLDYVDRFTEQEAGSPVKDKQYYPLQALYAVDNTCQEAFGFQPSGYEPKLCPRIVVVPTDRPDRPEPTSPPQGCQLNESICASQGPGWYFDAPSCSCQYLG